MDKYTLASHKLRDSLVASDKAAYDRFGWQVATNGRSIFVSGDMDDQFSRNERGAVYVFDAETGQEVSKIVPEDAQVGDQFGWSMAVHDNHLIVGAPLHDSVGRSSGAAYIFNADSGLLLHKIEPEDSAAFNRFGWSVDIQGNIAIVGSRSDNNAVVATSGAAYTFDVSAGTQINKLSNTYMERHDFYGWDVAVSLYYCLVSAIGHSEDKGVVYVYDTMTGEGIGHISPNNLSRFDRFGTHVNINGRVAAISSRENPVGGDYDGSVYVIDVHRAHTMQVISGGTNERFGHSVVQQGFVIAVGAPMATDENGDMVGAIYIVDMLTGKQVMRINSFEPINAGSSLGQSIALHDNCLVAGAPYFDNEQGTAFVYDVSFRPSAGLRRRRRGRMLAFLRKKIIGLLR